MPVGELHDVAKLLTTARGAVHRAADDVINVAADLGVAKHASSGNPSSWITVAADTPNAGALDEALGGVELALRQTDAMWKHTGPVMHGSGGARLLGKLTDELKALRDDLSPIAQLRRGAPAATVDLGHARSVAPYARHHVDDISTMFRDNHGSQLQRASDEMARFARELAH